MYLGNVGWDEASRGGCKLRELRGWGERTERVQSAEWHLAWQPPYQDVLENALSPVHDPFRVGG